MLYEYYKHVKTGGLYKIICEANLEWDMTPAVVYENIEGVTFVRPKSEFFDGRFTVSDKRQFEMVRELNQMVPADRRAILDNFKD